tara:strand:- start:721 stop:1098 length:378 start_codon:yes stop_codon:yes gene_type:complete
MAFIGNVSRWFNRKGYGFIRVETSDNEHTGQDLFVHLSGINVSENGYKSLYPGEYVSFDIGTGKDDRPVCVNVTGVLGGPLLIEHKDFRYRYFPRTNRDRVNDDGDTTHEQDEDEDEVDPENDGQ